MPAPTIPPINACDDDDGKPSTANEWDTDGGGTPDNYFFVQNPSQLVTQLSNAFNAILAHAGSASSASGNDDRPSGTDRPTFGWSSLTESERSVADLVADGLTNREAGTRLFLSHHTVDAHLRHIYRKLGISSRAELGRLVADL